MSKARSRDSKQSVSKACSRVVFENNNEALWGCADRTISSASVSVRYIAASRNMTSTQRMGALWPHNMSTAFAGHDESPDAGNLISVDFDIAEMVPVYRSSDED